MLPSEWIPCNRNVVIVEICGIIYKSSDRTRQMNPNRAHFPDGDHRRQNKFQRRHKIKSHRTSHTIHHPIDVVCLAKTASNSISFLQRKFTRQHTTLTL